MDQLEFLKRVLPEGNHYIAYKSDKLTDSGQPIWAHSSFRAAERGVALAVETAAKHKDVYFAVAAFKEAKIKDPKGFMKSYRKQENVESLKCVFLDIDYKNYGEIDKYYYDGTRLATLKALHTFLDAAKIEHPTILVETGGGIHAYWTFPEALPRDKWQRYANGLAGLAENNGLHADLQCTIDSARILRMPGTRNFKYSEPDRWCTIMGSRDTDVDMVQLAARLHGVTSMRARTARGPTAKHNLIDFSADAVDPEVLAMFNSDPNDLIAGTVYADEYFTREIAEACGVVGDSLKRGGVGDSYELWNNLMLLTSFTEDGRQYAHSLSLGDERYSAAEVDAVFDDKLIRKLSIGPTTCSTFSACAPALCALCPHNGKIKSPIMLGKAGRAIDEILNKIPDPTFVHHGATWMRKPVKGDVIDFRLLDGELSNFIFGRDEGGAWLAMTASDPGLDRSASIVLRGGELNTPDHISKAFGTVGFPIHPTAIGEMKVAMTGWINKLRKEAEVSYGEVPAFGWVNDQDGKHIGFSVGGTLYTSDGREHRVAAVSPELMEKYTPKGEASVWREAAQYALDDDRIEPQIALASAFAAPLMAMTGEPFALMALRSLASGAGKSTYLAIAQAAVGDPKYMVQMSDTKNAIDARIARTPDLPQFFDEVQVSSRTGNKAEDFRQFVFHLLQGKEKSRLDRNSNLKTTSELRGLMTLASNMSIRELLQQGNDSTDAGVRRVLELEMPLLLDRNSSSKMPMLKVKLMTNYGHQMRVYAIHLARHKEAIQADVQKVMDALNAKTKARHEDRFWVAVSTAIITGALHAKAIGILPFDVPRIMEELCNVIVSHQSGKDEITPEELAGNIINDIWNNVAITDRFYRLKGTPPLVETIRSVVFGSIRARIATKDSLVLLSSAAVRDYSIRHGEQFAMVADKLRKISETWKDRSLYKLHLGSGMDKVYKNQPRERVFIFKADDVLGPDALAELVKSTVLQEHD